jgi:hypothetical protein
MGERRKPTKQQEQQRTQDDLLTSPKILELNCGLWLDRRLWFVPWSVVFCSCIEWGVVDAWIVGVEVTNSTVGAGCCRWAHRTVRCASHITQPLGFWRFRPLELCLLVALDSPVPHRTTTVHCPVRLLATALTLRELSVHCAFVRRPLESTVALASRCSAGAPDSPMNYSEAALLKPEGGKSRLVRPWAPDTVRWHTGQSGAPDQGSLRFLLLLSFWTLTWSFYWFVSNL